MEIKVLSLRKHWTVYKEPNLSIHFIGYIEYNEMLILKAEDLLIIFSDKIKSDNFYSFIRNEFLPNCNGNFAIIVQFGEQVIAVTDHIRNYPIYFFRYDKEFIISDHIPENLMVKSTINTMRCEEFLLAGLVVGNDTVFDAISSLQPAEILSVNRADFRIEQYFNPLSDPLRKSNNKEKKILFKEMDELFLNIFSRMLKSCPNVRKWIVPLSGGHDSRLIINYFHRLGCKNVICFTYGNRDSKEVNISKEAASILGYEWHFVDYFNNDWIKFHKSDDFNEFISYSFNGCNLPHVQDLIALKELKDKGIIMEGDVVVPGHTAFTESESKEVLKLKTENDAIDYIFAKYFTLFKPKNKVLLKKRLSEIFHKNHQTPKSFADFFNWQERQVKYIGNSVRAYEFFGLDWRMPFWEKDVIEYWQSIDYDDRIERKIFFMAATNKLFVKELLEVPIIDKFKKPKEQISYISKIIPLSLKSVIASLVKWKSNIPEGTNQIFVGKGKTVKEIVKPINIYPKNIKDYIKPYIIRRPYQMNVNSLMAIYTLRNEVFLKDKK